MGKHIVHVIAGPTASGKSDRAMQIARARNGVVINADSMQLYEGLPILTAQPDAQNLVEIPHRLYSCLKASDHTNAMSWRDLALVEIYATIKEEMLPIVVGGSGFYLKALMQGLSPIPEIPEAVRVLADDLMDCVGIEEFYSLLIGMDPALDGKIDPHNRQRLIRAYEVTYHTGQPMSYWQSLPPVGAPEDLEFDVELILPEREVLYARCNERFDRMVAGGVVEEATAFDDLISSGAVPADCPLVHALGFVHLQEYLSGEIDLVTAIELSKSDTRHYAKRQATWFRHQLEK